MNGCSSSTLHQHGLCLDKKTVAAFDEKIAGKTISESDTKAFGCSIKRINSED